MNVSFGEVYVEHIKIDRSSNGVMYEPSKRNEGKKLLDHYAVHFFQYHPSINWYDFYLTILPSTHGL